MTSSAHQEAPIADSPGLEQEIGATIREARRRAGITMTALASATGLSQAFLSHLETGRSAPSVATLYRLAQALNVLPQDLLLDHQDETWSSPGEGTVHGSPEPSEAAPAETSGSWPANRTASSRPTRSQPCRTPRRATGSSIRART
ncbi:helix-turn-helix domain-containing protein [Nonomuraea thailandensis]